MQKAHIFILSILATACTSVYAAQPVTLSHKPVSFLKSFVSLSPNQSNLKEVSQATDFKQTKHIRIKQYYNGVPVLGGDAVVHVPKNSSFHLNTFGGDKDATMNGLLYLDLAKDLGEKPALQSEKVMQFAIKTFQIEKNNANPISQQSTKLIIFVDDQNKAHWAYQVSFLASPAKGLPAKPNFIIDATTLHIYQQWDNIKTEDMTEGGGFGGNLKMGQLSYDGLPGNLPTLKIERSADAEICYLQNDEVTVKNRMRGDAVSQFICSEQDPEHNNLWWSGDFDKVNGGYSPSNDAFYVGSVIQNMYMEWYNVPALVDADGKQKMLNMRVHEYMDNAYWDGEEMTFGDGISMFYPLVSLGVGAHEVSHGFTEQHSDLAYYGQSGGLNEAFSDMAAQAAEFYSVGKNSWEIGPEIMKRDGALRYMDQPSKDCRGRDPGNWCSIDKVSQYYSGLDVHYSSGIFNHVFYLIGTAEGWDTRKAFDVMAQANSNYWTSYTNWSEAACGVLKATADYSYNADAVKSAFADVEIDITDCE